MNLTNDINGGSNKEKQYGDEPVGQDMFSLEGSTDFSDVFLLGGNNSWDYNDCSMIPENYFSPKMFEEEEPTVLHSPKAMKADDGQAIPQMTMKAERKPAEMPSAKTNTPVTKQQSLNTTSQARRKSSGPQGMANQNWYNMCQQPNTPTQQYQPSGLAYAQTSPYLEWNATATSPGLMNADPYAWMHSGRPKRTPNTYGYPMTSPPMIYQNSFPPMGMYAGAPQSPQFGFVNPMYMVNQSAPKLPVQALPPRPEPVAMENKQAEPMMAPLILPIDLGKRKASSDQEIDPTAISSAISAAFSRSTGSAGESNASTTSSNASLSPTANPHMDNMKLYESTFKSFIKEESTIDYSNVTVIELKKLLRRYQLTATGKKEELIRMVKDVSQFLKSFPPQADSVNGEEREKPVSKLAEERVVNVVAEEKDYTKFFEMS